MELGILVWTCVALWAAYKWWKAEKRAKQAEAKAKSEQAHNSHLQVQINNLKPLERYQKISDAEAEALRITRAAQNVADRTKEQAAQALQAAEKERKEIASVANAEAKRIREEAKRKYDETLQKAQVSLNSAFADVRKLTEAAEQRAQEIAGDAYRALQEKDALAETAKAMRNIIEGYGDAYLVPSHSVLDDLAMEFTHTDAGAKLSEARTFTASLVKQGGAADCAYADPTRRKYAIEFVVDAFNGKVDSIISRLKTANVGTLRQEIQDAYQLVNHNGTAFRDVHIKPEYLQARLEELNWGAVVLGLKDKEREEQRAIKEQIREEERARREIEKALKDAAKEEEILNKALEKARKELEHASEEKRAQYEAKLTELQAKLQEAEAKNQRALSMAQQTRAGHVYIISNVGSFGEQVYKVGMTRRLEPMDRVKELGDASVPFEFDVHAMIYSDDAPGLENALHRAFNDNRLNKVNFRKEFFSVNLADIRQQIEGLGYLPKFTMLAEAAEYRETLAINQMSEQERKAKLNELLKQEQMVVTNPLAVLVESE